MLALLVLGVYYFLSSILFMLRLVESSESLVHRKSMRFRPNDIEGGQKYVNADGLIFWCVEFAFAPFWPSPVPRVISGVQ